MKTEPRVIFYEVKNGQEKIQKLLEIVHTHFFQKESLYIKTEDFAVAKYVDNLLWKHPTNSFLPHGLDTLDRIAIGAQNTPSNEASAVLNLSKKPLETVPENVEKIFELEDTSKSHRDGVKESHYSAYKALGLKMISL